MSNPDAAALLRTLPGVMAEEARYRPVVRKLTVASLIAIHLTALEELERRNAEFQQANRPPVRIGNR